MKLYYTPGACSLSPHIVLKEAGYTYSLEKVNLGTKQTETGEDFREINEKGYIPVLKLEDGEFLTEGAAIVQYLADLKPESGLAPRAGTIERVRLNEWLAYISTELHKGFSPLFGNPSEHAAEALKKKLSIRLDYVEKRLKGHDYLIGHQFTIADAYLFTVLNWSNPLKFDLSAWPSIVAFMKRVADRPQVKAAMQEEGLIKA
ncbi:MAG: glutathione transferase GstA [Alphaproteobacteria bacterium]|nr:glutathione transferase GstA [Alphaproteobacteria bacterium]